MMAVALASDLTRYEAVRLRMRYGAGQYRDGRSWEAVDELRPLQLLSADLPTLFPYTGRDELIPPPQRSRPRQEVLAASLLACVEHPSPWEEEWVGFWRDHFSINGHDGNVRAFVPHWDRAVIRTHAWGNFRSFLEAVATHPCMLYYLNNRSSRAGGANENYARELFELHTFGRKAYLNTLYANWRAVPGAGSGKPVGYIDEDVYEAARAFTGWSVEDGSSLGGGQTLPKTGRFTYVHAWHDPYQKRVLAQEFPSHQAPRRDGQAVLDLCAEHRATATHLAVKIARRFLGDEPPRDAVTSIAQVWWDTRRVPDQLRLVFEHVRRTAQQRAARMGAARVSGAQKVKRPMRLVASFVRAVNLPFTLGDGQVLSALEQAGPSIYAWASPEGPPDELLGFLSAGYLRQRMSLLQGISENWWGTGEWDPLAELPTRVSYGQVLAHWERALFGRERPELSLALLRSQELDPLQWANDLRRARRLVGLLACAPSFQTESLAEMRVASPRADDRTMVPKATA